MITGKQYQQRIYMGDEKTCSWLDIQFQMARHNSKFTVAADIRTDIC